MEGIKKFLIIGINSQIGNYLYLNLKQTGYKFFGTTRRIENLRKANNLIYLDLAKAPLVSPSENFDFAIFCAGVTDLDFCDKNLSESKVINVTNTIKSIEVLLSRNTQVIFLSSNLVFEGAQSFYKYLDKTAPITEYGKMKAYVENSFKEPNFSTLRLTKVLTEDAKFLKEWNNCIQQGKEIFAYKNCFISPISLEQVLEAVHQLVGLTSSQKIELGGVFQLGGNSELSYFDFAHAYFNNNERALHLIRGVNNPNVEKNQYNSLETFLPGFQVKN